jgi:hypothetical protein
MTYRSAVLGIVVSGLIVGCWNNAIPRSRFQSVGFELSGSVASMDPDDFNGVFESIGFKPIDHASGVSAGVFADLAPAIRVFGTVGFMRGATDKRRISISNAEGRVIATTDWYYSTSSIPVAIGGGYRINGDKTSLVFSLAGEVHFVTVEEKADASGEFEGNEESSQSTGFGISGTVGAEWRFSNLSSIGIRGGYRLAQADVPYPNAPSLGDMNMDLSGVFAAMYVTIQPWWGGNPGAQ